MPIPPHVRALRAALSQVAKETKAVLPGILQQLPHLQATQSEVYYLNDLPELEPSACPRFELASSSLSSSLSPSAPSNSTNGKRGGGGQQQRTYGTVVKVLNEDSLDAAIVMAESLARQPATPTTTTTTATTGEGAADTDAEDGRNRRVAVLNLASERTPGGGWLSGAVAQEEALCYRSSLSLSLHRAYYPLAPRSAIYSRDVVVVRSSMGSGHRLLLPHTPQAPQAPGTPTPQRLPVVSVVSVAGVRKPEVEEIAAATGDGAGRGQRGRGERMFRHAADRDLTRDKMRLALRVAAAEGHELLVLGALGCGAFGGPPDDVARCWLGVLEEPEFAGGWFREVWFAVLDRDGRPGGNFDVFERVLGGREVGKVVVKE
ncbi:hypothetical protein DL766_005049 [Monosporascus sp. MC13-8B]|uniref:Microbial-type PARG catalytic domain-containing protein n=1 Tax=Monosporascus cannonballus TaxID=155416 RepID=A0ABY0HF08_9PEZI|nr:hypothetical protein DL763_007205 [Monosporascus cannonballus]RYO91893.1 hypothetical protein DL762_001973 [Monosporascus cannonballus]RYP30113.1 hypothetical protein DL766_005049 [Monosporascus sp. MC13-8B]